MIEPGKLAGTRIESFSGRRRDERVDRHCFLKVLHTGKALETWRRELIEERPGRGLGD